MIATALLPDSVTMRTGGAGFALVLQDRKVGATLTHALSVVSCVAASQLNPFPGTLGALFARLVRGHRVADSTTRSLSVIQGEVAVGHICRGCRRELEDVFLLRQQVTLARTDEAVEWIIGTLGSRDAEEGKEREGEEEKPDGGHAGAESEEGLSEETRKRGTEGEVRLTSAERGTRDEGRRSEGRSARRHKEGTRRAGERKPAVALIFAPLVSPAYLAACLLARSPVHRL